MRVINEGIKLSTSYDLKDLYKICEKHDVVSGTVIKFNPEDGFSIDLGNNIIAKMSLEDFEDSKNISLNSAILKVGKNIMAYIKNIDENNIVYLNRALLQSDYKKETLENLKVGTVFNTTVISLAPFGAFVDMGIGILGLLPIGDVSIARFSNIRDVFKVGDNITVVYKGKSDNGYVVSHKELLGTWEENLADFKYGEFCQGIIREIMPYGAFIEIAPNLTGLADFPEGFDIHTGDSVCVMLKSSNPEKLKVKLQIVSISEVPYKIKYNYKIKDGILSEWRYTPIGSNKQICSKFDGIIKS